MCNTNRMGVNQGSDPIGADDEEMCDGVSVFPLLIDNHGKPTRTIEGGITVFPYEAWAAENGIAGKWNAKDANGIHNVFRYAFNKPTGDFTLLNITFNEAGKVVIVTPPLVNGAGFAFSVVAWDTLDCTGLAAVYPLEADGTSLIDDAVSGSRFFRLRVTEE
ncbi:MAG: hypothetical protein J6U40_12950 [Kiritimatiellae bacterium]|nr:hypothetical protein [Kiritimatiellia bacterium]